MSALLWLLVAAIGSMMGLNGRAVLARGSQATQQSPGLMNAETQGDRRRPVQGVGERCLPSSDTIVVATVSGNPITLADVDNYLGPKLTRIRTEEYQLRSRALDEIIEGLVLEREASRRGLPRDSLFAQPQAEFAGADDAEALATRVYRAFPGRFASVPPSQAVADIAAALKEQNKRDRRTVLLAQLEKEASVERRLRPFRVSFSRAESAFPSAGPITATVEIVEFSDFQCPFCARASMALGQVLEAYPNDVRLVFRHFPLTAIHAEAAKAAEASACAGDQGQFWNMHDELFRNQKTLSRDDLARMASQLGLDRLQFDECLNTGKHQPTWQRDLHEGETYGINGTPTLFINGRLFMGPATVEALKQVVDEEIRLQRR